jgi:hypothetical protein
MHWIGAAVWVLLSLAPLGAQQRPLPNADAFLAVFEVYPGIPGENRYRLRTGARSPMIATPDLPAFVVLDSGGLIPGHTAVKARVAHDQIRNGSADSSDTIHAPDRA